MRGLGAAFHGRRLAIPFRFGKKSVDGCAGSGRVRVTFRPHSSCSRHRTASVSAAGEEISAPATRSHRGKSRRQPAASCAPKETVNRIVRPIFFGAGPADEENSRGGGMDEASERLTSTSGVQIARHFDMTNKDVFIYGG